MDYSIIKYPRTPHLVGSRLQPGDEDLSQIPFSQLAGKHLVLEEKIDGANSAISFDDNGNLLLQSRGHYLRGGFRERHYELLKLWANVHQDAFFDVLEDRYIMYGEWMYAKHRIYYDKLPAYFMEFDIYDRLTNKFLDTEARKRFTEKLPISSVPVLAEGVFSNTEHILSYLGKSNYISEHHIDSLIKYCEQNKLDSQKICAETEPSSMMEGIYIKVEQDGQVVDRLKYVRNSFAQIVESGEGPWINRPIIPNGITVSLEDLLS